MNYIVMIQSWSWVEFWLFTLVADFYICPSPVVAATIRLFAGITFYNGENLPPGSLIESGQIQYLFHLIAVSQ